MPNYCSTVFALGDARVGIILVVVFHEAKAKFKALSIPQEYRGAI